VNGQDTSLSTPICVRKDDTIRDTLRRIQEARPALVLDNSSPVVNLVDSQISDFLETVFREVDLPDPRFALNDALNLVLSLPEVEARQNSLHLQDGGIPRLPARERDRQLARRESPIVMRNATLRQALNQIAQRMGSCVWVYTEWNEGPDKRAFKLEITYRM
jgi:predicted ATPase